ncbi:hypothetical protein BJ508DRAFT_232451 [Ascobolus immersus RN42]|uniref:Uncharacterized protein n=1 Tax=Ascobolus immersus RN42 TaxID=1160509 RepID=A0A3N4H8T4_ASCIM|nr:hypothetical protein BJ508DRAFT_232451 [Ascobolus immersus RN42]
MADGLGCIASALQLVDTAIKLTKLALEMKDAPDNIDKAFRTLSSLKTVLSDLESQFADPGLVKLIEVVQSFNEDLEKITAVLQRYMGSTSIFSTEQMSTRKRFQWAISGSKDFEQDLSSLDIYLSAFTLALSGQIHKAVNESFRVLEQKHDRAQQYLKGLQDSMDKLKEDQQVLHAIKRSLTLKEETERRKEIENWLGSLDYSTIQQEKVEKRAPGTGEWILEEPNYVAWKSRASESNKKVLWCHGVPGVGKSFITSVIIDDLNATANATVASEKKTAVAYIYCNYKEQESDARDYLACVLRQLMPRSSPIPKDIDKSFTDNSKKDPRPQLSEVIKLLKVVTKSYDCVYVVIDALDECIQAGSGDEETRKTIIDKLTALEKVSLLVTSRPHLDRDLLFQGALEIEISAHDADLEAFIRGYISAQTRLARKLVGKEEAKQNIVNKVLQRSNKMFLLAKLLLEHVASQHSLNRVEACLDDLPRSLNGVYETMLSRIGNGVYENKKLGMQVMSWIALARRDLTVSEIREALAATSSTNDATGFSRDDLVDEEEVLAHCEGLVTEGENGRVRFIHKSLQDFLVGRFDPLMFTKRDVAFACIRYLTAIATEAPSRLFDVARAHLEKEFPDPVKSEDVTQSESPDDKEPVSGLNAEAEPSSNDEEVTPVQADGTLIGPDLVVQPAPNLQDAGRSKPEDASLPEPEDAGLPKLEGVVSSAQEREDTLKTEGVYLSRAEGTEFPSSKELEIDSPTPKAAEVPHENTIDQSSLDEVEPFDTQGLSVSKAEVCLATSEEVDLPNLPDVAKLSKLQENLPQSNQVAMGLSTKEHLELPKSEEMDIDTKDSPKPEDIEVPVSDEGVQSEQEDSEAVGGDDSGAYEDARKTFLEPYPFLSYAAHYWGWHVRNILTKGNCDSNEKLAHYVRSFLFDSTLALEFTAIAVDCHDEDEFDTDFDVGVLPQGAVSPLHIAAWHGLDAFVEEALARQLPIELKDLDGNTALHLAAWFGEFDVVCLLMKQPNAASLVCSPNRYATSPLQLASRSMKRDVLLHLLAIAHDQNVPGFDINALDGFGETLLTNAVSNADLETVKHLFKYQGLDPNQRASDGCPALCRAAYYGVQCEEVCRFLLAQEAVNVNFPTERHQARPLHFACGFATSNTVKMILERPDVDLNPVDADGDPPLEWAVASDALDIVELLLQQDGIQLDIRNKDGETALDYAKNHGHPSVIPMLEDAVRLSALPQNYYHPTNDVSSDQSTSTGTVAAGSVDVSVSLSAQHQSGSPPVLSASGIVSGDVFNNSTLSAPAPSMESAFRNLDQAPRAGIQRAQTFQQSSPATTTDIQQSRQFSFGQRSMTFSLDQSKLPHTPSYLTQTPNIMHINMMSSSTSLGGTIQSLSEGSVPPISTPPLHNEQTAGAPSVLENGQQLQRPSANFQRNQTYPRLLPRGDTAERVVDGEQNWQMSGLGEDPLKTSIQMMMQVRRMQKQLLINQKRMMSQFNKRRIS